MDAVGNELLNAYYVGSDIKSLRRLLESKDERLVGFGVWIASELGEASKQFSGMLSRLLTHKLKDIRFFALDCASSWTADESGRDLATAVALVDDEEKAVRWKALGFLSGATLEQLESVVKYIESAEPQSPYLDGLRFLLSPSAADPAEVLAHIQSSNPFSRKFGVAAAFKIAKDDARPLQVAASSDDDEISLFANDMLRICAIQARAPLHSRGSRR